MQKTFQKTEAKSLQPHNDGGEARVKTERENSGYFSFLTRMEVGSISLLQNRVYICDREVASWSSATRGRGAQLSWQRGTGVN